MYCLFPFLLESYYYQSEFFVGCKKEVEKDPKAEMSYSDSLVSYLKSFKGASNNYLAMIF
jgi:hypothetical protein